MHKGPSLQPTQQDLKKGTATYHLHYPSVYQTSDLLRFELVARPKERANNTQLRLGVGHTLHVSKYVYNHVWCVNYKFRDQRFSPATGTGKQALSYDLTTLSTTITARDAPSEWMCELQYPPRWENCDQVQSFFGRVPDKYDKAKVEANCYFHILLLEQRFPGRWPKKP